MEHRNLIPYQRGAKSPQDNLANSTKVTASPTPKMQAASISENQSTAEEPS